MSSTTIGLITAGCTFSGALIGVWLQRRLPRHHLDKDSQEVVKLGAGMIATITALVLGLLVSSAKGTFDTINDGIKQSSARIILLDRILAQYGPEAQGIRDQMKRSLTASLEAARLRQPAGAPEPAAVQFTNRVEGVQSLLRVLTPQTDGQRQLLAQAQQIAGDMSQTRWLLMEEAQNELPVPLLVILVCWLTVLFVSFGLFAPRNATVLSVLFVCACSVSAAVFLILEMNRPLEGMIKVSNAPLRNALEHLGR
jgi:hypothetical protein